MKKKNYASILAIMHVEIKHSSHYYDNLIITKYQWMPREIANLNEMFTSSKNMTAITLL